MATGMSKTIGGSFEERKEILDFIQTKYQEHLNDGYTQANVVLYNLLRDCADKGWGDYKKEETNLSQTYRDGDRSVMFDVTTASGIYEDTSNKYYLRLGGYLRTLSDNHYKPKSFIRALKHIYNYLYKQGEGHYEVRYFNLVGASDNILVSEYISNLKSIDQITIEDGGYDKINYAYKKLDLNLNEAISKLKGEDLIKESKTLFKDVLGDINKTNILFEGFSEKGLPKFILMDPICILDPRVEDYNITLLHTAQQSAP